MSIEFLKNLPSPDEIKDEFPLGDELTAKKQAFDAEIRDVFTGNSDKFVAVIGSAGASGAPRAFKKLKPAPIKLDVNAALGTLLIN